MTRNFLLAFAVAALMSAVAPAFAEENYLVNCNDASQSQWAQCIVDRMGDNEGDE